MNSDVVFESIERCIGDGRSRLRGLKDDVGGADDALSGAAEDVGEVALFGHGVEGPAGDVAEGVLAGVEPVGARHHVRDRFGFHLDDPPAVAALLVRMEDHVTGLMGEGLDGLGVVGVIAFIGLLVPHAVRLLVGPGHGRLLWISAVLGALVLLLADTAARTIAYPTEIPVGAVTALVGAPVFFALLLRTRTRQGGWA